MELISREVAIEEFEDMVTSVSVYGESAEARYATNARIRFIEKLNSIPTVDAAPLDKLCKWLEKNACYYQAEDNGRSTRFSLDSCQWKIVLAKWMEEQDAAN